MNPLAIVILGEASIPVARQIQTAIPEAVIYGLANRTQAVDVTYENFGDTVRELFRSGTSIIGICAAGIMIRTIAPLLTNKWQEPPVLAIAEDGSAVVPLLGGLQGVNSLARRIADVLQVAPAITTTGELRFQTALLSPPPGYQLVNPDDAKTFIANLLAGATVKLIGTAPWLEQSRLPIVQEIGNVGTGKNKSTPPSPILTIQIVPKNSTEPIETPSQNCLVYQSDLESTPYSPPPTSHPPQGKLTIVGTGPGSSDWMTPEVKEILQSATDWVGYKTYLNLAEPLRQPHTIRHESDNRVELDRARAALDLAATGRTVAIVSSGDPGIYAMAAAVFEVLERELKPEWQSVEIQVCPGISAMQAAAAQVGAPLGHDFCTISLSDILKPWEVIAQRIAAAAQADFAIAFYNPVSQQRTWQLEKAKEILLQWRSPQTPIVLARNLGRPGQTITVKALEQLAIEDADMRTVILIGSSKTRIVQQCQGTQWVYTPRHY
ncbi:precorrin-3B C(17)-methyltransferase [Alkalinema sp. FACHB-956]|uniref:precorrin-3B C(17)-methyltransferase n=1 Tax=Alkalinema sp. FACHB-956 TaxID=2692768 RepID=UPI0016897A33|nr:precorrin-3B C(17)-methyltransferase [Alkalinema sp. FACHB-956]MBD2328006.1 precorrin-3B C(17)-methyltransferase [Alkalinema sp. FACHB-956]